MCRGVGPLGTIHLFDFQASLLNQLPHHGTILGDSGCEGLSRFRHGIIAGCRQSLTRGLIRGGVA